MLAGVALPPPAAAQNAIAGECWGTTPAMPLAAAAVTEGAGTWLRPSVACCATGTVTVEPLVTSPGGMIFAFLLNDTAGPAGLEDLNTLARAVTLSEHESRAPLRVPVPGDALVEGEEPFIVTLSETGPALPEEVSLGMAGTAAAVAGTGEVAVPIAPPLTPCR